MGISGMTFYFCENYLYYFSHTNNGSAYFASSFHRGKEEACCEDRKNDGGDVGKLPARICKFFLFFSVFPIVGKENPPDDHCDKVCGDRERQWTRSSGYGNHSFGDGKQ